MKKIIKILIIFLLAFVFLFNLKDECFAGSYSYKVNKLITDNSDRIIYIKGSGNISKPIQTFSLTKPTRYVIDIQEAILQGPKRTYRMQNSEYIDSISLSQFSNTPETVRIVFTLNENIDVKDFKTYSNNSSIVVKYKNNIIDNSIQYKFYTPNGSQDNGRPLQNTLSKLSYLGQEEMLDLTPRFQTKFFLNKINQNSNGIILKGIGSISLQRATFLNNSLTVILDDALVSSNLENKTYTIPDNSNNTLTINKLSDKKVKLTILGQNLKDYRFIISPDGQNLFIANRSFVINTDFVMEKAKVSSYNVQKTSLNYYIFDFNFTVPVAYNVFEQNDNFYLDIDNLSDYNYVLFEQMLKKTDIKAQAIKISSDKTRFIIPETDLNFAYANVESNAKSIQLCFRQKNTVKPLENPSPTNETVAVIVPPQKQTPPPVPSIQPQKTVPNKGNVQVITKNDNKKNKNTTISPMIKVVIDPGHGGSDSGAISKGVYEKNLNLEVAKLVKEILEKKNIHVYMTRSKDVYLTLDERTTYSNEINPDIYVSIHTNSTLQENSYGLETHYYKDDSFDLAKTIHSHFASSANLKKWDTKDRGVIKSRFYVINHTEAPSVLIEMGFISNGLERSKLITKTRQAEIAQSIADGILEYLKVK